MRLTHIRLLVADMARCFRFYRDSLGLTPAWGDENSDYASFKLAGEAMIALFKRDLMDLALGIRCPAAQALQASRALIAIEVGDLAATTVALVRNNVEIIAEAKDYPSWGIRAAHCRDPEGNLIELYSPLPAAQWSEDLIDEAAKYRSA